jgi:nitrate/TMAO reductase-like tetraheme cytochrome c subunit
MRFEIPRRAAFLLLGLVLGAVSSGLAQGKAPAVALNPQCLSCHGTETLAGSVHSGLGCTDCHRLTLTTTATADLPHPKTLPPPNCTERCHRADHAQTPGESPIYYPDSVHGRDYLTRGVKDVARCWDCHGKHNIRRKDDPASTVNRRNIPLTCSTCHENQAVVVKYHIHAETPYQEYRQSVHGKALFEKGLLTFAAVCTDCHGVHNIQGVGQADLMAKRPETCGRCHILILEEYRESIHGREALKGNVDAPLCVDCHGEHKLMSPLDERSSTSRGHVPDTCSTCHARPEVMRKYGVPEDRIQTFIGSMHGIAAGFGSKATATCSDCHGVHDIRPASDPQSQVNPAHLAATCGRVNCHPGMPDKIRNSKVHLGPDKTKSPVLFIVQKVLVWAVLALVAVTVVWFSSGLVKRLAFSRKK